jgi:hypothetical protein
MSFIRVLAAIELYDVLLSKVWKCSKAVILLLLCFALNHALVLAMKYLMFFKSCDFRIKYMLF